MAAMALALAGCSAAGDDRADPVGTDTVAAPAASTPGSSESGTAEAEREPLIAIDGEGLRLVASSGATRLIAFGEARAEVERVMGETSSIPPIRTEMEECGAGPMQVTSYGDLSLNFQDDQFVGWFVGDQSGWSTMDGISTGSTRSSVESTRSVTLVEDSTLGVEFRLGEASEGGIGGFFEDESADAMVTGLYAGTNCFFR
ncbi:hypothetical protein A6F65_01465 [Paraurantiacibacter namhicola]|uniref:Aspartate-semialdehyde dehydrogenase n=2 Tax=Paraurantiacibacter namhicola TaxID=645517 RepID=A0A1C7D8G7_9SPHN|nr:hypothetical protein A6F65_01465 [Paraurantiacibacter namhicola]